VKVCDAPLDWLASPDGSPQPDWARIVRESRDSH